MKLIKNKDIRCIECKIFLCCDLGKNHSEHSHKFCSYCGEPIEWITERTVEEVLEELLCNVYTNAKAGLSSLPDSYLKQEDLKQELLNKINK